MPFSAIQRWPRQHATTLTGAVLALTMSVSLAWQAVDWLRLLRTTAPPPSEQTAQQPVRTQNHNLAHLFGANASDSAAAAPTTSLRLTLLGSFVHADSSRSSAIISSEGRPPQRFSIDSEITPGVRLSAVHADHIVLLRSGQREILAFPRSQSDQSILTPAEPATATMSQVDQLETDNLTHLHERMDALRQQMEASARAPTDVEPTDQTTESN